LPAAGEEEVIEQTILFLSGRCQLAADRVIFAA
jgi:hypothetical protein